MYGYQKYVCMCSYHHHMVYVCACVCLLPLDEFFYLYSSWCAVTLHLAYDYPSQVSNDTALILGLKRMVNLLSGYPDASICGYPTDSDIIKLVLLAIFISTSSAKYSSLSILISV